MNIILDKISYKYSPNTTFESTAVKEVSFKIEQGEFIGLIGPTGSGKSTLIRHLNGLLKASSGQIYCDGQDIYDKDFKLKSLRSRVGMVFQYPEHQLFEATVLEDVKFGPKNQGLSDKDASIRAYEALEQVSFPLELVVQSPFDLSGGQKRLAAIAGVLAMKPEYLILDEPTAGLDPKSRKEILRILKNLKEKTGSTIMLVSHNMADVAEYCDRVLFMNRGKLVYDGNPTDIFANIEAMERSGLYPPETVYLAEDLRKLGINIGRDKISIEEIAEEILKALKN